MVDREGIGFYVHNMNIQFLKRLEKGIRHSVEKFQLNLTGKVVLTEAATGNYVVTPVIAAVAGAKKVYAFTKNSEYGTVDDVKKQTYELAERMNVSGRISVVTTFDDVPLEEVDMVTNTGFLRPINRALIERLSSKCVIPLMYEPWELRDGEIDLKACEEKGIMVCGTDESDSRLGTMDYIGFCVLYFLLDNKLTPFSTKVLLVGCDRFVGPVYKVLKQNGYTLKAVTEYSKPLEDISAFDAIVVLEHQRRVLIIGDDDSAFINKNQIREDTLVIHICGEVDFRGIKFRHVPKKIRPFGYMSVTTDFIDPQAVIDLHTAGLKVAEGMLRANEMGLIGKEYRKFLEENYPALAFEE